jgi:hypothetical protein
MTTTTTKKISEGDKKAVKTQLKELRTKLTRMDWLNKYIDETDKKHLSIALENVEFLLNNIEKY